MNRHGIGLYGAIIVSIIVLVLDCAVSWWALANPIDPAMHDIVIFVAGNVNAMALAAVNYWLGSSSGSMIKSSTLAGETEVRSGSR